MVLNLDPYRVVRAEFTVLPGARRPAPVRTIPVALHRAETASSGRGGLHEGIARPCTGLRRPREGLAWPPMGRVDLHGAARASREARSSRKRAGGAAVAGETVGTMKFYLG